MSEVKNLSKKLIFNKETNTVTKEFNNEQEGVSNPILQVKRQHLQFVNWLRKLNMFGLPIERAVIISKPTTKVETTSDNQQIFNQLIYAESLLDKLEELEKKYPKPVFSKRKTSQLVDLLLAHHQTPIPDILQTYKLSKNDIKTGVFCHDCETVTMDYYSANWHCPNCGLKSKTAHLPTVDDFFLLMGPTMTRKQFADFTHNKSIFVAGKQLRALNLPFIGANRGTKYTLSQNQLLFPLDERGSTITIFPPEK
jgi:hypothetical protein